MSTAPTHSTRSRSLPTTSATALATALLAALLILSLALAPRAEAFVYWAGITPSNESTIARANLDGTGADRRFITVTPTPGDPSGVAVDAEHVYWSNNFPAIGRANLDGTDIDSLFITLPAGFPSGVAVDAAQVYWADAGTSTIGRANLDGTGVDQSFISGDIPSGVAVDAAHVYWADSGDPRTIGRANLDGTGIEPSFITLPAVSGLTGLAVDAEHVYWADTNTHTIGRANLDGTGVEPSFITGAGLACGVAVDAAHVYWKHGVEVGRANLDGTGVDRRFISDRTGGNCGVAVDALRSFSFAEAKKTTRSGKARLTLKRWTARVTLKLPAPGKLELARTRSVKGAKKRARAKGTVKLPVSPRGKAKHRLKIESECLRGTHTGVFCSPNGIVGADVKAVVTYTPRGGDPSVVASTLSEEVRLVRRCRGC